MTSTPASTLNWDGSIPAGGSVTLTIQTSLDAGLLPGTGLSSPAIVSSSGLTPTPTGPTSGLGQWQRPQGVLHPATARLPLTHPVVLAGLGDPVAVAVDHLLAVTGLGHLKGALRASYRWTELAQ